MFPGEEYVLVRSLTRGERPRDGEGSSTQGHSRTRRKDLHARPPSWYPVRGPHPHASRIPRSHRGHAPRAVRRGGRGHFQPGPEEVRRAQEDPENYWLPGYTPDQAGLVVFRIFGRWFAVWESLEKTDGPEALKWTVLRIVPAAAGSPHPVDFFEV
jgi:hypothetical protein